MGAPSRGDSLERIVRVLESFQTRGGYMELSRADEIALGLTPQQVDEICARYPFYGEWRRDLRPYYERMELALETYGDGDHPGFRVAEAELEIEYARLAERYGLRAARWDGTTGQMVPTTWDADIRETKERLALAREELERAKR